MAVDTGTVVVNHGVSTVVETEEGTTVRCSVRGKRLRPVCGDRVEWMRTGHGTGVISRILARDRALLRADGRGGASPVASALDRVLVVVAPTPEPDPMLIDRYLIMCELGGIETAIVVNKTDLAADGFAGRFTEYTAAGHAVSACSARTGEGLAALGESLASRVTLLAGQSGVGKSSMLNALVPDLAVQTGVLAASGKGRHTTSTTIRYRLPAGGALVDSPGVRDFWLPAMPARDLERGYREIASAGVDCRFRDCVHDSEPGCAVALAVTGGTITERRYRSYRKLLRTLRGA